MTSSIFARRIVAPLILALLTGACAPRVVRAPSAPPPSAGSSIRGKIVEVLEAGPDRYLLVATSRGEHWVAVPAFDARVGADVVLSDLQPRLDYESPVLGRRFERVYFGRVGPHVQPKGEAAPRPPPVLAVAPATGPDARTVAQVWAERAALAGRPVAVRGQVVKVMTGVLDGTWYHLRDGSGSPARGDHDLTVLTPEAAEPVKVGAVVTFRGTVAVEKDFGAGYVYPVIVVDATAGE